MRQNKTSLKVAQEFMQILINEPTLDATLVSTHFQILAAHESGFVHSRLTIQPRHLNRYGSLHGGMTAYLADVCGSISVAAKTLNYNTGVSTDINVSYFRKAESGDVDIVSNVDKIGSVLAFTAISFYKLPEGVEITKENQGEMDEYMISRARHTKFVGTAFSKL